MTQKKHADRINLAGIIVSPRIGVTVEERSKPQECEVDLATWSNLERAASQDSIDSSIDYCRLLKSVQETASSGEFSLVETLAYKIVRKILQEFPVDRVRVKIRKRPVSIKDQVNYVEIRVEEP